MLTLSQLQLLELWEELMKCVHNANGYGGNVAEIYVHRFMQHSVYAGHNSSTERAREDYAVANRAMYDACRLFEQRNGVKIRLESGHPLEELVEDPTDPFTHRVHLEVYEGIRQ